MKRVERKLRGTKGESFIEILIAILIVALGCMLIATMYSSAMALNTRASEEDQDYYEALSKMERIKPEEAQYSKGHAFIEEVDDKGNKTGKDCNVRVYMYGDDTYTAYEKS